MAMTVMYNGTQFAPVTTKQSIVISHSAEVVWSVVRSFGRAATWMGSVEGQRTFSQLLGGETVDYIGAVRVFGIADKMLFEQLVRLDNTSMLIGWQLMTHPMNSNPFPAAFLNFKGELQVWPVSLPSNSNQCFVEWRMDLLTEQHAVDHMTQAMKDIMTMSLSNLIRYMNKSNNNSGGSSAGSATTGGGIVGSTTAPVSYGIQFMPQPQAIPQHNPPLSQAMMPAGLSGNSAFLQQPSFVPAPGQNLGTAVSAAALSPFQQHQSHPPMHGPFSQQQFANYQANPGFYPHQYPQQPQSSLLQQQQQQQQQQEQQQHAAAHQLQQQQAAAAQLQQQTQHLGLHSAGGSGSSYHSSQYASQRPLQRILSSGSHRGTLSGQFGAEVGPGGPSVSPGDQLSARPSQEKVHEAPQEVGQPQLPAGGHMAHMSGPGQQAGQAQAGPQGQPSVVENTQ